MSALFANLTHYFNRKERLASGAEQDILNVPLNTVRAGVDVDFGRVSARAVRTLRPGPQGQQLQPARLPDHRLRRLHGHRCECDRPAGAAALRSLASDQQPVRRVLLRETGIPASGRVVQAVVSLRVLAMTGRVRPGVRDRGRCRDRAPVRRLGGGQHRRKGASTSSTPAADYFPDKIAIEDAANFTRRVPEVLQGRDDQGSVCRRTSGALHAHPMRHAAACQ